MKKVFSILICLSTIFIPVNLCHSATTSDGLITLDFFEDTTQGIPNLWQLDFTVNDVDGPGGFESLFFTMIFETPLMDLNNQYNQSETEFYSIHYFSSGTIPLFLYPIVTSTPEKLPVPAETVFTFNAIPVDYIVINPTTDILVNEDFSVVVSKTDNFGNHDIEILTLNGPVRVESIPEPMSLLLYVFGFILLPFLSKKFISKK